LIDHNIATEALITIMDIPFFFKSSREARSSFWQKATLVRCMSVIVRLIPLYLLSLATVKSEIIVPGADGSDGTLNISSNTVIDLSMAVTGNWDANNSANAGKGIYDSAKWAVVFKYTDITIAAGATVTFKNYPSRAPVVWLVSGDVNIAGTVNLNGQGWQVPPNVAEPGPGGFRGGFGFYTASAISGPGFGPGGGQNSRPISDARERAGGSYGSLGSRGSATYGNPSLLPLIGGSGGSGDFDANPGGGSGGGGGGAILIACSGILRVDGAIIADGGDGGSGNPNNNHSGGGSGGAVRLVCNDLSGAGVVHAIGGGGQDNGGLGRVRIERVINSAPALQITPDPSVVPVEDGSSPLIWLPNDGPTARIVSIGATIPPADPRASFGAYGADVTLPLLSTTPVVVETVNAENASVVRVRVMPRANGNYTETTATVDQVISSNPLVIRWVANVPVNPGYSAVQVRVVRP
jgi:hypothetical protein